MLCTYVSSSKTNVECIRTTFSEVVKEKMHVRAEKKSCIHYVKLTSQNLYLDFKLISTSSCTLTESTSRASASIFVLCIRMILMILMIVAFVSSRLFGVDESKVNSFFTNLFFITKFWTSEIELIICYYSY